jgi:hypothetical protein
MVRLVPSHERTLPKYCVIDFGKGIKRLKGMTIADSTKEKEEKE